MPLFWFNFFSQEYILSASFMFYTGTSNVVLPYPNRNHFPDEYREKSRLAFYSTLLNSVEINSSFYKLPMRRTTEKWAKEVQGDFRFTFKLSKSVTHCPELKFNSAEVHQFWEVINGVEERKGCVLLQFPASFKSGIATQKALEKLLQSCRDAESDGWQLAVEFRNPSWYEDRVYQLLEDYAATLVKQDMPKSFTPLLELNSRIVYLRFHGEQGRYGGTYSDAFLEEYAGYIREWIGEGKEVYAYFNNTRGEAIHNVIALNKLLKA